jgi:hypothetical protein
MEWARRRCSRRPNAASPPHRMQTKDRALCGARLMRSTEYWEEMPEPADMEQPLHHEMCYNCWRILEAMK